MRHESILSSDAEYRHITVRSTAAEVVAEPDGQAKPRVMKHTILTILLSFCLLHSQAADEPLIPAALNAVLPKIQPRMTIREVEAVLATAYPNAKGGILDISGATGYIAYQLNERFILSVTLAVRDGKEVVHDDMQLILHDGSSKRRLDLKVFEWEKPKEKQPKSK